MLTNAAVKAARPRPAAYKIYDERGLFLFVGPTGLKSFRFKYRFGGKEKLLTIGRYPELQLQDARDRADQARELLAAGRDPGNDNGATDTFESTARAWHADRHARWSEIHAADVLASLENDIFPALGPKPIGSIDAIAVLEAIQAIEARGAHETARRVRQRVDNVFAYAMVRQLCSSNPASLITAELAPAPVAQQRHPALLEVELCRELLHAAEMVDAAAITKHASRFLALTAVRMAPLRFMQLKEVEDLDGPEPLWRIPAAHMKLTKARKADPANDHLVPLSPAAAGILRAVREAGYNSNVIFPLGAGAISALYARAGYDGRHVPHGWRASFSTIMNDQRPGESELIDLALAHVRKNKVEAAYNRAEQLGRRRDLYCRWAALLTGDIAPTSI